LGVFRRRGTRSLGGIEMTDLERMEGLFVGQLNARELRTFERAVEDGDAYRSYEGGAGFMGLAKVRLRRVAH
jgi:hypothetical protein